MSATKSCSVSLAAALALVALVSASSALAQGDAPEPSGGTIHAPITVPVVAPPLAATGLVAATELRLPMSFRLSSWVVTRLVSRRFVPAGVPQYLDGVRLAAIQRRSQGR